MDTSNTPIAEMLSSVLSNPELLQKIRDTVGTVSNENSIAKEPPASPPSTTIAATASSASPPVDGLASILANPEMMAKLPQVMALLSPMLEKSIPTQATPTAALPKSSESHRNELLLALKPFLSPERQNAVDVMLRVSQLGQVLRHIK